MKKRKKRRRKIFLSFLLLLLFICIIIYSFWIKSDSYKLKKLNYSDVSIKYIIKNDLINDIYKHKYSKIIDKSIIENKFIKNNINIYFELEYIDDKDYIKNINKLISIGYNSSEIKYIIKKLTTKEINILSNYTYMSELKSYLNYELFDINNLSRYINYKKDNNLEYKDIIMNVNMNLDYDFYENIDEVEYTSYDKMLINKYYKLKDDFVPTDLVNISSKYSLKDLKLSKPANKAFNEMCAFSSTIGLNIKAISAYRTKAYQLSLYNSYVKNNGIKSADKYSARSRHSEHETGLAIDLKGTGSEYTKFENTNEYKWVKDNAYKYGFIIRYPKGKENITGYGFEAWHIRFVGKDVAKIIYDKNLTLEEYYVLYVKKNN